jgi:hypothetical protein
MWLLAQSIVMIVVGVTGVIYEWTPNPVALGIVMVFSAWLFTKAVSAVIWMGNFFGAPKIPR